MISIDAVREAVGHGLGDTRVAGAEPGESLVESGLISSIEIVAVALALEERFDTEIPDSVVTVQHFDTLESIGRLIESLSGTSGAGEVAASRFLDGPSQSISRALRRPVLFAVLFVVVLVGSDFGLRALVNGPLIDDYQRFREQGQRLYPVSGGYSTDDLSFSVREHRASRPDGKPRIAVFGDSGTIGSWVRAEDAIAGKLENMLRGKIPDVRVDNLAFFMQYLAKDLMILEALLQQTGGEPAFSVAVVTLGDGYFNRPFIDRLPTNMPYLSLNTELLSRFAERLPESSRGPLLDLVTRLEQVASEIRSPGRNWMELHSALFHYAPFFRTFVDQIPFFESVNPNTNIENSHVMANRPLYSPVPLPPPDDANLALGIGEKQFDGRIEDLLVSLLDFFSRHGVATVLYLKPHGPNEWRDYYKEGGITAAAVAERVCHAPGCRIVDARWLLSGEEFTDSTAHYNVAGNTKIAEALVSAVLEANAQ